VSAPRPVAGLPAVDPTLLAKAWLLALLDAVPLEHAPRVPVADVAQDGPALCAAVVAAVADDAALLALSELGTLAARAGTSDAADTLAAVEALRASVFHVLRGALGSDAEAALLADTADRLAYVTHVVATAALRALAAPAPPGAVIAAQDTRDSWAGALAKALDRNAHDGEPFALLAGEVSDRERWAAADPGVLERAVAAVTAGLRAGDRLVADQPGRWWLIAPGADTATARALAHALAEVAETAGPAGVAFGIACCPHDGIDAEALVAHADEALFSALASGLPVA
jgi:GGDEF domain-containing protein